MNSYTKYILIGMSFVAHGLQAQEDLKYHNKDSLKAIIDDREWWEIKSYNEDSLRAILAGETYDSARVGLFMQLSKSCYSKKPDTCLYYAKKALALSRQIGYMDGIRNGLIGAAEAHRQKADFAEALKLLFELLKLSQQTRNIEYETSAVGLIGINYFNLHQYEEAVSRLSKALTMFKPIHHVEVIEALFNIYLGKAYSAIKKTDSAFYYLNRAFPKINNQAVLRTYSIGDVYLQKDNKDSAKFYYKLALQYAQEDPTKARSSTSITLYQLAVVYNLQNQVDSSLYFARNAYTIGISTSMKLRILEASALLSKLHRKKGRLDSAIYYQDVAIAMNDSVYGKDKFRELQVLLLDEQQRNEEIQRTEERRILETRQAQERFQNKVLIVGLLIITTIILVASILLFRSNRIKQKTNLVLQQALGELKATQSQLIQSEKMASLGELTAGIAHEIQNPLNFVNNFSEVNDELIDEMNNENDITEIKAIANDIKQNNEKISFHGKRADAIVKGMLEHSKASTGVKEPTDINKLADEYLRLSYHGMRAKDKSFEVKIKTDFDESIGKVNVISQDIGRVLLNLFNNAFYAVNERKKTAAESYQPGMSVETKKLNGCIQVMVSDNGTGIPQNIVDKIFQPFFTTKPTGQGTGLGLSLAYDIIKAHGGEIKTEGREGEGSEFIIQLPYNP